MNEGDRVVVKMQNGKVDMDGQPFFETFEATLTGIQPRSCIVKPVVWLTWMDGYRNAALDPDGCLVVPTHCVS